MTDDTLAIDTLANTFASQQTQDDEKSDEHDHFEPRQATLFLVDTTPKMFEEDPQTGEIPFLQSLLVRFFPFFCHPLNFVFIYIFLRSYT